LKRMRKESIRCVCACLAFLVGVYLVGVIPVSVSPIIPNILLNPSYYVDITKTTGTTFSIALNIENVDDLYTWEVRMKWYGPGLNVTSVAKGPFLESGGYSSSYTVKVYNVPDTKGESDYFYVAQGLLGAPVGVDGSGTLATINFKVEKNDIQSGFDLYSPKLVNSLGQVMEVTLEDGYFANITWAGRGYPGDVDDTMPRDVDIYDLAIVARAMGTDSTFPPGTDWGEWNSAADLNGDLKVDVFDLFIVGINYGQPK